MKFAIAVKDPIQLDAGKLALTAPMRTTVVVAAIVGVGLATGHADISFAMTIGALFTGISDPSDADGPRLTAMSSTAIFLALGTMVGATVAGMPIAHLVTAFIVAAACGYVGVLGARAVMGGTLTLVVFIVYSGSPPATLAPWELGAFMGAGGVVMIAVTVAPWVLKRYGGARSAAATSCRNLALAAAGTIPTTSTALAEACMVAHGAALRIPGQQRLGPWLVQVTDLIQRSRLGLIALGHLHTDMPSAPGQPPDAVALMRADIAGLSRQLARALVWPVRARQLTSWVAQLTQSRQVVLDGHNVDEVVVMAATAPLLEAGHLVGAPWPHGTDHTPGERARSPRLRSLWHGDVLMARLTPQGRFANHAMRLAIAVTVATAVTSLGDLPHEYWIPMTVAWMARPDLGGTLSRVGLRVVGTLAGVLVCGVLFSAFQPGTVGITLIVAAGTFLAAGFLVVNYAYAVAGITIIVLTLFSTGGDSVTEDIRLRVVATLVAGVITMVVASIRPQRQADRLVSVLASTAAALHAYASSVAAAIGTVEPPEGATVGFDDARAQVLNARSAAQVTLVGAEHEPGSHGMSTEAGSQLLSSMVDAVAEILIVELEQAPSASVTTVAPVDKEALPTRHQVAHWHLGLTQDLHQRLDGLASTGQVPPRAVVAPRRGSTTSGSPNVATLADHLEQAHRVLDALAGAPTPSPGSQGPGSATS